MSFLPAFLIALAIPNLPAQERSTAQDEDPSADPLQPVSLVPS